ncbi:MAG: FHA domain-containing protein [Isosphaeraceae bacterium]
MFSESCGGFGPLRLECVDGETGTSRIHECDRPALILGRDSSCDLVIDAPQVGRRHAYFQLVEGRLFAVSLGARDGLRWGGVPRNSGWVDPGRPVTVGPITLEIVGGFDPGRPPTAGPPPTSSRYTTQRPLPEVVLEARRRQAQGPSRAFPVDRPLTLVGTAESCQLRLGDPEVSRFDFALVLCATGLWVVDLTTREGVTVNGVRCHETRLEDGDRVSTGGWTLRAVYNPRSPVVGTGPGPAAGTGSTLARTSPPVPPAGTSAALVPELLRPLLELDGAPTEEASRFGEALLMLIRLLGDVHRDHLDLVREELEQIRRLSREMAVLKARSVAPPTTSPPLSAAPESSLEPSTRRPDPVDVHFLVGERLAAWESERESRWRKVIGLLVKP